MKPYALDLPRKVLFGISAADKLTQELPQNAKNILLVAGNHVVKNGLADQIADDLRDGGKAVNIISGISAEPPLEDVDKVILAGRSCKADAVVALGGGSVIDTAKAAAAIIPRKGLCADYFSGEKTITEKGLFFAALPTTAGTGAEMTKNSVLTEKSTKIKKSLRSPFMTADLALVDPNLTFTCPPELTAASGLDAFVQAVEAYTNPAAGPYSKALAMTALVKIASNLEHAYREPDNIAARSDMAEGSMLAGMAFAPCGLGAVHGLAHPIGSLLHVPHGIACAILMPYIFEFNAQEAEEDYAVLAYTLGKTACTLADAAGEFVRETKRLAKALNVPETFREYGLKEEHFPFIVKNCRSASMKSNPREMSDEQVLELLKKLV